MVTADFSADLTGKMPITDF